MHYIEIICILLLLTRLCYAQNNSNNAIQESKTRFYDFNISVEINDNPSGLTIKKFLLNNNGKYIDENSKQEINCLENSLYVITNQIKKKENKQAGFVEKSDTVIIHLTNIQMDSLFTLTKSIFWFQYDVNSDVMKLPSTKVLSHKTFAKVIFDLGFRGNKYVLLIKYGDSDVSENRFFIKLLNFLKNIKS